MPFLIYAIFSLLWFFPPYKKQGRLGKPKGWTYWKAFLLGLIPATILLLLCQFAITYLMKQFSVSSAVYHAVDAFVCAALIEECVKFLFAVLVVKKADVTRKIDYALLFGAVGLGYQAAETFMMLDSVLSAILRGAFAYHLMWQMCMGLFFYEAVRAKEAGNQRRYKWKLLLSFAVPIILHGFNDFIIFMAQDAMAGGSEEAKGTWILAFVVFLAVMIAFVILTEKRVFRAARESREADAELPDAEPAVDASESNP